MVAVCNVRDETGVWQRRRTGGVFCDGAAKPELVDSCSVNTPTPCFCRMRVFVAHVVTRLPGVNWCV